MKRERYSFGGWMKDAGLLMADNALSLLGGSNIIQDKAYENDKMLKASKITNALAQTAGVVAAGAVGGPMGAQAMSGVQQGVGKMTADRNPQTELSRYSEMAGNIGSGIAAGAFSNKTQNK